MFKAQTNTPIAAAAMNPDCIEISNHSFFEIMGSFFRGGLIDFDASDEEEEDKELCIKCRCKI